MHRVDYSIRFLRSLLLLSLVSVVSSSQVLQPFQPELVTQLGHSDDIKAFRFAPDGRTLLTAGLDKTAILWSVPGGEQLRTFGSHSASLMAAEFSQDGALIATGSADYSAAIWNSSSGKQIAHFVGHRHWVHALSFSADKKLLLTGSFDKRMCLWDIASSTLLHCFQDHTDYVQAVSFSPDGRFAASGGVDGDIFIYRIASRTLTQRIHVGAPVKTIAYSADGSVIVSGDERGGVTSWSPATGQQSQRFGPFRKGIIFARFSKDGQHLLVSSQDTLATVLDPQTGGSIKRLAPRMSIFSAAISPDEKYGVSDEDGTSEGLIWDLASGNVISRLRSSALRISSSAMSQDGRFLLFGSGSGTAILWDISLGREIRRWKAVPSGEGATTLLVALSSDGQRGVSAGTEDGIAILWDMMTGSLIRRFVGHKGPIESVALSRDGRFLLTGGNDSAAMLWSLRGGPPMVVPKVASTNVSAVAFSKDSSRFATGGDDGTARIFDCATGKELARVSSFPKGVGAIAFSSDREVFATGSDDNVIRIWNAPASQEARKLTGHEMRIESLQFSEDDRFLLSGSWDGSSRLWDIASGTALNKFDGHGGWGISAFLCPATSCVVTTSQDGRARFWRPGSDKELFSLVSASEGWMVANPSGQFDASNLEFLGGMHWVFPDDPFRALAPEVFLRDYYEPGLLPRLWGNDPVLQKPMRPLTSLNRAQPVVSTPEVVPEPGSEGLVTVRIRVRSIESESQKGPDNTLRRSGVYDLRLFQDGQLVGQRPSLGSAVEPVAGPEDSDVARAAWKKRHELMDTRGQANSNVIEIPHVRLPRWSDQKEVRFSAYAFNEDRVKSATAATTFGIPKGLKPRQGKAYLITVGVNRTESSPAWDLNYAANDARELSHVVSDRLARAKQFTPVPVCLVSDHPGSKGIRCANEIPATKAHLKAVLDLLAGREVNEPVRSQILKLGAVERAEPEDLVLLTFSSHGYTDPRGTFHFVLGDIGTKQPQRVTDALNQSTLSTDELSAWLREVNAGEMVMVVDACQSEATIQADGFKPGPMGSRGLGQLAYDKGMRVLAASKGKESAFERDELGHGLLTYALVKKGLEDGEADWQPKPDGKITMGEWLAYAEQEVPKLFESGRTKGGVQKKGAPDGNRDGFLDSNDTTPARYQQPTLFDFNKNRIRETLLVGR